MAAPQSPTPATPVPAATPVLIVGAGPAGLALATALARQGIASTLVEGQSAEALAAPAEDGRDIALTHRARAILEDLGLWQRLPAEAVAPLRHARVHDGGTPMALPFDAPPRIPGEALGWLVPNHHLRQIAHDAAREQPLVQWLTEARVTGLELGDAQAPAQVQLQDGRRLQAALVVAADSRFSGTRRLAGLGADWLDFGRTAIVCRMQAELGHGDTAHECFGYGGTLALLPMSGRQLSAVLTLSSEQVPEWMALTPEAFAHRVAERAGREAGQALGALSLTGPRHAYPLVATYAHRFHTRRLALLGDAAVGMHPVTAHGYNFGLYGVQVLAQQLGRAGAEALAAGAPQALAAYAGEHRRVTRPIYLGTNAIVRLFTDDRAPARLARRAVIELTRRLPPIQALVTRQLTGQTG